MRCHRSLFRSTSRRIMALCHEFIQSVSIMTSRPLTPVSASVIAKEDASVQQQAAQQQPTQKQIVLKLNALAPTHLEVVNESHMHSVPVGSESHFKVVLVSSQFEGRRQVARHQTIYQLLAHELANGVHALALHTYTNAEWQLRAAAAPESPQCMGGSKHDQH